MGGCNRRVRYRNIGKIFLKYRKKKIANIGISVIKIIIIIKFAKYRISECMWISDYRNKKWKISDYRNEKWPISEYRKPIAPPPSKAFWKSTKQTYSFFPWFLYVSISVLKTKRWSLGLDFFSKPICSFFIILFSDDHFSSLLFIMMARSLDSASNLGTAEGDGLYVPDYKNKQSWKQLTITINLLISLFMENVVYF